MTQLIDFQLEDILIVLNKWKKHLIAFVLLTTLLATVVSFLLPKKYLATAVCFPSNPVLADKSFIFNENIQNLYATYGSSPELDRLISTAQLDTLYRFAINKFDLRQRYKIKDTGVLGLKKTIKVFKKNYNIEKTVLGELKVHTWDKDRKQSAKMANAILEHIGVLSANQNNGYNSKILEALNKEYQAEKNAYLLLSDSISTSGISTGALELLQIQKKNLGTNLSKFEKLITEFTVAVNANAPALQIQEYARAQAKPDKPKKLRMILLSFVFSCFFGILLVFVLENKKS